MVTIENFKNLSVYILLRNAFIVFMLYAGVDLVWKITEQSKYDMNKVLFDVKKKYPNSTLTFQNIRIEDTDSKLYYSDNGRPESYYETTYVYIRNNKLHKEPNFLIILYFFPSILFLIIFHQDIRTLKIKNLKNVSIHTWSWMVGSVFVGMLIHFFSVNKYEYKRYKPVYDFRNTTSNLLDEIDLSNYKKY